MYEWEDDISTHYKIEIKGPNPISYYIFILLEYLALRIVASYNLKVSRWTLLKVLAADSPRKGFPAIHKIYFILNDIQALSGLSSEETFPGDKTRIHNILNRSLLYLLFTQLYITI